jgi:UDP-sugar transporter A1/2/3
VHELIVIYRKGFATSLSIIMSFLASVALFSYPITLAFVVGSSIVLLATYLYNAPSPSSSSSTSTTRTAVAVQPGSPIGSSAPILGEPEKPSRTSSMISLLGLGAASTTVSRSNSRQSSMTDLRNGLNSGTGNLSGGMGFTPVQYGLTNGHGTGQGHGPSIWGSGYSASAPGSPYLSSGFGGDNERSSPLSVPPRRASPRPNLKVETGQKGSRED